MITLTEEEIRRLARLAQLALPAEEIKHYAQKINQMLKFIEQINQVETTQVDPCLQAYEYRQSLRPDQVTETNLSPQSYQQIAPQTEANFYLVPKVLTDAIPLLEKE